MLTPPDEVIKSAQYDKNSHFNQPNKQGGYFINLHLVLPPCYGILTTSTNNLGREK